MEDAVKITKKIGSMKATVIYSVDEMRHGEFIMPTARYRERFDHSM